MFWLFDVFGRFIFIMFNFRSLKGSYSSVIKPIPKPTAGRSHREMVIFSVYFYHLKHDSASVWPAPHVFHKQMAHAALIVFWCNECSPGMQKRTAQQQSLFFYFKNIEWQTWIQTDSLTVKEGLNQSLSFNFLQLYMYDCFFFNPRKKKLSNIKSAPSELINP